MGVFSVFTPSNGQNVAWTPWGVRNDLSGFTPTKKNPPIQKWKGRFSVFVVFV